MEDIIGPPTEAAIRPERRLRRPSLRVLLLLLVILSIAAAAAWYGWNWWTVGRFFEATDDAYLQADNVTIAPKVGGIVTAVPAHDNQKVAAGDLLVQIDDRDYQAVAAEAQANLKQAEADLAYREAQEALQETEIQAGSADVAAMGAAQEFARQEQQRYEAMVKGGAGTTQRVQQASSELSQKTAGLARTRASLEGARRRLDMMRADIEKARAVVGVAKAKLEQAELDLAHTRLTAPIAGVIGDKSVRVGQFIQPGTRLLTIVPVQDTFLVANFKETQLAHVAPGEPVTIEVDALPGQRFHGTVESLAPGSGSQFSLLPPENATGNFTKIVQRVPVKILLDRRTGLDPRLRPGLSATASVDTRGARPHAAE